MTSGGPCEVMRSLPPCSFPRAVRLVAMRRRAFAFAFACLAWGALSRPADAQPRPRALQLGAATARLSEPFDILVSALELADGRVVIPEPRARGLVVADLAQQVVTPVGRKGRGPGEYEFPGGGLALGHDSTLVQDLFVRRWLVLHGARIVRTLPPDDPAIVRTQGVVHAADSLGHVLMIGTPPLEGERVVTERDSSVAILVDRATGRPDTVARLRRRPLREWRETDATGKVVREGSASITSFTAEEVATLFGDGWLAVVRLDPFRVDWRRPDGTWIRGVALPIPVIRNDARERAARAHRNAHAAAGTRIMPSPPIPRSTGSATTLPPFERGRFALQASLDGRLLVRRTVSADYGGTRYLVIDRTGRLDGEVALPASSSIVGFGRGCVYLAETDEDDVARLARYAWPPR